MTPAMTLAGLLAISMIVNAALGVGYLGQRDKSTAVTEQRDAARSQATACSDATDDLRTLADKRKKEADSARAAAAATAKTHNQRADYTLGLQPKDPANSCASMQALADDWIKGRAKP